jgi:hypothetical protein
VSAVGTIYCAPTTGQRRFVLTEEKADSSAGLGMTANG